MTLTLKKSNKFNLYDICFIVSAFSMLIILLSIPYEINRGISLGTYAIAGCSMLVFVKYKHNDVLLNSALGNTVKLLNVVDDVFML